MAERSRNLGDAEIRRIVGILDGWTGKLTWDGLIKEVARHLGCTYTRQALHKHERIRLAFSLHKEAGDVGGAPKEMPVELRKATERIARLEAENKRLELENQRLLAQFARWAYNANTRNLDEAFLDRPLPTVDRGQTKERR